MRRMQGTGERGWGTAGALRLALLALAPIAVAIAGCGGTAPTDPAASATRAGPSAGREGGLGLAKRLEGVIDLDADQVAALEELDAVRANRVREPGDGWRLAADVEAILSADQVAALGEAIERRAGPRARPRAMPRGPRPDLAGLDLTEAQRAEIREILEARRPETRARIEAVLTAEQRDLLAGRRAEAGSRLAERRETMETRASATRRAMEEALQLTEEQAETLSALREGPRRGADRATARAGRRADLASVLSEEQQRIVGVYRWLAASAVRGRPGRQGSRGGAGPGSRGGAGPVHGHPGPRGGFFES